jgi:hypothetical protein
MTRMQLPTALVAGLFLGACTSAADTRELGGSREALSRAQIERAVTPIEPGVVEAITPVKVVPPLDRVRPRIPPIFVDPGPATPPSTPAGSACSNIALWISTKDVGCPRVGEASTGMWRPRQAFVLNQDDPDAIEEELPEALANVCAYDWVPRVDEPPDLAQLTERLREYQRKDPEYDCPVMTSLAPDDRVLDGELWRAMRDTAHQQAGQPRGAATLKTRVFMGVIDSAAHKYEALGVADTFGHGRLVARMIQDLNCFRDSGECASVIHNRAALLYDYKGNRNTVDGGYIGTREDLSVAIHRAVNAYVKSLAADGKMMRGIINLSLGWDPMHGGVVDSPSQLSPASHAVWAALARASCVGMINIAAAGNSHGTSTSGAVLPAAWQNLRAPNSEECRALMYRADGVVKQNNLATSIGDRSVPLCVAVAAADERDKLLSTTRTGSESRHVAYGLSMVTDEIDSARGEHTSILTGSSFAAAVMSAAVAGAWAVDPALTPREVIELVYKASEGLGTPATLAYAGSIDEQRRISVCSAIQYAGCNHGACDPNLSCERIGAGMGKALWTPELFERAADAVLSSSAVVGPSEPSALAQPWVGGQPHDDGCNRCNLRNLNRKVTLGFDPPAASATKDVYVIAGGSIYYVPPPVPGGAYPESMSSFLPAGPAVQQATVFRNLTGGAALYEAIAVLNE